MTISQLAPTALPGRRYGAFVRGGGRGIGSVTALWLIACPGRRYGSFAGRGGSGTPRTLGRVTQLLPTANPGCRYAGFAGRGGQGTLVVNPLYVATATPRRLTQTAPSTGMAATQDLFPPIDALVEYLTVTLDYGPMLASGVTIGSVVSVTCSVHPQSHASDPTPAARLLGSAQIGPSPATGLAAQAVLQQVGGMVGSVTYLLQCVVATSDGNRPSLWTHLACVTPG